MELSEWPSSSSGSYSRMVEQEREQYRKKPLSDRTWTKSTFWSISSLFHSCCSCCSLAPEHVTRLKISLVASEEVRAPVGISRKYSSTGSMMAAVDDRYTKSAKKERKQTDRLTASWDVGRDVDLLVVDRVGAVCKTGLDCYRPRGLHPQTFHLFQNCVWLFHKIDLQANEKGSLVGLVGHGDDGDQVDERLGSFMLRTSTDTITVSRLPGLPCGS